MAEVKSARRYYLRRRLAHLRDGDVGMASVWQSKQEAEAGTALPATFPNLSTLSANGYSTVQDLDGADADELTELGLTTRQAETVMTELAALL